MENTSNIPNTNQNVITDPNVISTGVVPYHIHNGVDSPQLESSNILNSSSIFDSFLDIVHWNSLDGWSISGAGNVAVRDGSVEISTPNSANTGCFIYTNETYFKIHESNKLLSIEWQVGKATTFVNGVSVYLYMSAVTVTPPTSHQHFGFTITDGTLYCSNADGTARTTASLNTSVIAGSQRTRLRADVINNQSIKYYVNGTLMHTTTTSLPAATDLYFVLGITTPNTTLQTINLNRILINKEY